MKPLDGPNFPLEVIAASRERLPLCADAEVSGRVLSAAGTLVHALLPGAAIGDEALLTKTSGESLRAVVSAVSSEGASLVPYGELRGLVSGSEVKLLTESRLRLLPALTPGSVVDCFGALRSAASASSHRGVAGKRLRLKPEPISALDRPPIDKQYITGIRSIDGLLPIGFGQRLSIIAPPGVGKSTLLLMLARRALKTINVFALIGERGREVRELINFATQLGILQNSILVVSTAEEAAPRRIRAAWLAIAAAEYYRDQGKDVILAFDSLTRLARAYREAGVACGETALHRGYPASVFAELPRLIERAGRSPSGSITAFFTLLADEGLSRDPIAEEAKSLTDGHLVLTASRAERGCYPALDVTRSVSRLSRRFMSERHADAAKSVIGAIARLEQDRDLALMGSEDQKLRKIMDCEIELDRFLNQDASTESTLAQTRTGLYELASLLSES